MSHFGQTAHKQNCPAVSGIRCTCNDSLPVATQLERIAQNAEFLVGYTRALAENDGKLLAALNATEARQEVHGKGLDILMEAFARLDHKVFVITGKLDLALAGQPRRQGKRKRK